MGYLAAWIKSASISTLISGCFSGHWPGFRWRDRWWKSDTEVIDQWYKWRLQAASRKKDCAFVCVSSRDITTPIGASSLPLRRSIAILLLQAFKVQQLSEEGVIHCLLTKRHHIKKLQCVTVIYKYETHTAGQEDRKRARSRCNPTRREIVMGRHRWRFTAPQQWYIKCKQATDCLSSTHTHKHGCIPIPWNRPVAPGSRCW